MQPEKMILENKPKVFYKKAYFAVERALKVSTFISVVGPRMVGKTTILMQLQSKFGGKYYSFKEMNADLSDDTFDLVLQAAQNNESVIFYLDEITYLDDFGRKLSFFSQVLPRLAAKGEQPRFKIIISGSQEHSILSNVAKALGGRVTTVYVPFLSFGEFLVYKNRLSWNSDFSLEALKDSVTEDDFYDYLINGYTFNSTFTSSQDYLMGCIEESINSEMKESWPDTSTISIEKEDFNNVLSVIYTILIKLHAKEKYKRYGDYVNLLKKIRSFYNNQRRDLKIKEIPFTDAISSTHFSAYQKQKMKKDDFFKILRFLYEMHLINFIKPSLNDTDLSDFLQGFVSAWNTADDFLLRYNPYFSNAQFFMSILDEIGKHLGITAIDLLDCSLLGSMVECMIRESLTQLVGLTTNELNNTTGAEVDCIVGDMAIEISVRNKSISETHFDSFTELANYKKILLTNDILDLNNDIKRIPYYVFLAYTDFSKEV